MPSQPLQPFAQPSAILSYLPNAFSGGFLVLWGLFAVFIFWFIYTLVVIYHWVKYSHASTVTIPAIGIHLFISFTLIFFILSGAIYL